MVVSCCIVNCTNRALKGTKQRFYRIPSGPTSRRTDERFDRKKVDTELLLHVEYSLCIELSLIASLRLCMYPYGMI